MRPGLVELGIIELKQKEYPAEQLKAKFEPEKPGNGGIEFYDPNPVTEPIGTGNPKREPVPEPEPIPEPQRPAVARNKTTKDLLDETDF